jgi:Bacterial regulatory proteins, luxR family
MGALWRHTRSAGARPFPRPPADGLLAPALFFAFEPSAGTDGYGTLGLAAALHITEHTVKTHVASVLRKLELRDRVHVVIFAYESALVDRA